jgi:hypothetical protein
MFSDLRYLEIPIALFYHNCSVINLAENYRILELSKYINVHYYCILELTTYSN